MTNALTLTDVLTRRLHVHWYEGIAVVRDVAERLSEQLGPARIPELHQIDLLTTGSVSLTGGLPVTGPVRRLGQLLQAMLADDAETPVQLRLIVSQATAPIPSYSSIAELDQALAYFERPDRAGLLKALAVRAETAGPVTADADAATLDRIAPIADPAPAVPVVPRRRMSSGRPFLLAGGVIAMIAATGAAALYAKNAGMAAKGRTASRATVAAADAVGAVVMAGVSAVSDRVGLGRLVAAEAADPATAPAAPFPLLPASKPKSKVRATGPSIARLDPVSDLGGLPAGTSVYEPVHNGVSLPDAAFQGTADTPEQSADARFDSTVYGAGSDGVSPPIGVRPQLPRQLPPTADPAQFSQIELTIAADGSVESARLLGHGRDVRGGMLLSAAKAWQFKPATKNGAAVRYRKTILVSFD